MLYIYCGNTIATLLTPGASHSFFRHSHQLLATKHSKTSDLSGTDSHLSQTLTLCPAEHRDVTYTAFGFTAALSTVLIGFKGALLDETSGYYILGNGYRAYNPVLMRFNAPDSFSPFGTGGINAYAFVSSDPVNNFDHTGHTKTLFYKGPGQRIANDTMIFRSKSGNTKTLSIDAHSDGKHIFIDNKPHTTTQLLERLSASKAHPEKYDRIILYCCHTADRINNIPSYAQTLSNQVNIPVIGHHGNVRALLLETTDPLLPMGLTRIEHRVFQENPSKPGEPNYHSFNYNPEEFFPISTTQDIRRT